MNPKRIFLFIDDKDKDMIKNIIGEGKYHSDFDVWVYDLKKNFLFRREMVLFFSGKELLDAIITDYVFGNKVKEYVF